MIWGSQAPWKPTLLLLFLRTWPAVWVTLEAGPFKLLLRPERDVQVASRCTGKRDVSSPPQMKMTWSFRPSKELKKRKPIFILKKFVCPHAYSRRLLPVGHTTHPAYSNR